ncbi:helix-turn-helix domain-containing protein [Zophobihabitans entericus]|uniref:Helix-turn-helix transcriptional regulator n=1 Tax=Zophobihabitans entericus TaxID=1635327 RepID=A0A6G9IB71_9GAMM|nr:helix-turn-helix transcriptional regulator [Zophobihabitans entericus]QIQ20830.1 helix-turn-helix transcriptional regulator [Zophobihabitans entericus]
MDYNDNIIAMLCRRIKYARIAKNLSQFDLAERARVGIATIKRIELGESITLTTLISVLKGLDELDQLNHILAHSEPTLNKNTQQAARRRVRSVESTAKEDVLLLNHYDAAAAAPHVMRWK